MEALGGTVELVGVGGKDGVWTGALAAIREERLGDLGEGGRGQLLALSGGGGLEGDGIGEGVAGRAVGVGGGAGGGDGRGVDGVHGGGGGRKEGETAPSSIYAGVQTQTCLIGTAAQPLWP